MAELFEMEVYKSPGILTNLVYVSQIYVSQYTLLILALALKHCGKCVPTDGDLPCAGAPSMQPHGQVDFQTV